MNYPVEGSCQCGGVTYQLHAAPLMVVACHCKACQKLSTSAFSITAIVNATDIEFQGALAEWCRTADSGNINGAKFCPTCGNRIYHFNPDEPDKIKLKPSNLSDTSLIQPTAHVWVSQKQAWYTLSEGVVAYDEQP
ncbi:GFA family protein [Photobacterium sp. TY1-4]|uniref:GFA family protein n=1 Tax=Photobacterium sp. TY1-4 TaxID=2899122 RepID=UPI0021C24FB6|nr:GFA family protein [Photobacterium sp. TY1-4]UXH99980.1 GFA family protein [Photobacterium sp. TY1-4]